MRYKMIAMAALAAGMLFSTSTAKADDYNRDYNRRDLRHDYANADRLRADIARDQYRMQEDLRCGRTGAAQAEARDIARDRRALDHQMRDIRHDRYHEYWR